MTSLASGQSILGFTRQYAPLEQILRADERWRDALSIIDAEKVDRICTVGASPSSDLYSLAATLYHLMTGIAPVECPIRALSVSSGKPDPLLEANELNTNIAHHIASVLTGALNINPDERSWSNATAMRKALNADQSSHSRGELQSRLAPISGSRIVRFPVDKSMGTLYLREPEINDPLSMIALGEKFGEARGLVRVPSDKSLLLAVPPLTDLRPLGLLHPNDLQVLPLETFQRPGDLQIIGSAMFKVSEDVFKALAGLQALFAARVGCSDGWLRGIHALTSLEWLNLGYNGITNEGLINISRLKRLRTLDLTGNQISDEGLKHLSSMSELRRVSLEKTRLCDSELQNICRITWLEELSLRGVSLTDSEVAKLQEMDSLRELDISQNPITDIGLKYVAGLSSLEGLDLSHTQVSLRGLLQLRQIPSLQQLTITGIELDTAEFALLESKLPNCEIGQDPSE